MSSPIGAGAGTSRPAGARRASPLDVGGSGVAQPSPRGTGRPPTSCRRRAPSGRDPGHNVPGRGAPGSPTGGGAGVPELAAQPPGDGGPVGGVVGCRPPPAGRPGASGGIAREVGLLPGRSPTGGPVNALGADAGAGGAANGG